MIPRAWLNTAVVGLAVGLAGYAGFAWLTNRPEPPPPSASTPPPARSPAANLLTLTVPPMTLRTITGQSLRVPAAPVTVLYFMSAECGSCIGGERQLAALAPKLPAGTQLISVDVTPETDPATMVAQIARAVGAHWPQAYATLPVIQAYRVGSLDQVAVVTRRGQVVYDGPQPSNATLLRVVEATRTS